MSVSPGSAAFVRELVYRRAALVIEDNKHYLIESRLDALAETAGFRTADELIGAARGGDAALQLLMIEAMTTHETSFFRDDLPFENLRVELLPRLVAARAEKRSLRIWCAACSSGQEPYSIAMLVLEHFPQLVDWPISILATDLSEQILARARAGRYRQFDMNRGLPAAYMLKYFARTGSDWEVKPEVRRLVEFRALNLVGSYRHLPPPDIVFLRNVLIYFDQDAKKAILQRIRESIAADGALFLGAAETTLNVDDRWVRVPFKNSSYYQPGK